MVFHWSLCDSMSPQVSRTRLSILAVLSNAVVWIVSTLPPTSKSSRPFYNPFVIVPNAPIIIGTIVTYMFNSFFNSLTRSRYLSLFSLSFRFILWSTGAAKSTILQILFFLLIIMRSCLLAGIRWSVCMLKVEVLILLFTFLQIYSVVIRDSKVDNFANSLFFKFWSLLLLLLLLLLLFYYPFVWDTLFNYLVSSPLACCCPFPIWSRTRKLPFLQEFWFFLGLEVPFFPLIFFSPSYYQHDLVFYAEFRSYIWDIYSCCLYSSHQSFSVFFFVNSLMSSM